MWRTAACLIVLLTSSTSANSACERWTSYQQTELRRFTGTQTYAYRVTRIAIDADGAPNAYNTTDTGIDALANAGFPNHDWPSVIVPDPSDPRHPFVQTSGPF